MHALFDIGLFATNLAVLLSNSNNKVSLYAIAALSTLLYLVSFVFYVIVIIKLNPENSPSFTKFEIVLSVFKVIVAILCLIVPFLPGNQFEAYNRWSNFNSTAANLGTLVSL